MEDNNQSNKKSSENENNLVQAVKNGDIEAVNSLLESGENADLKCPDGYPVLQWAAELGFEEILKLLLEKGADINALADDGMTTLHAAANGGQIRIGQILIDEYKQEINSLDNHHWPPLNYAIQGDFIDMARLLVERGADPNLHYGEEGFTSLHFAVTAASPEMLKTLLENGGDVNISTADGLSLMHCAINTAYPEIFKILIEAGLSINKMDNYRWTALHYAINEGYLEIIRELLDLGANPYYKIADKIDAFAKAKESGDQTIINLLKEYKNSFSPPSAEEEAANAPQPYQKSEEEINEAIQTYNREMAEKSEYLIEKIVSNDQEKLNLVKRIISKWSNAIPHHDMKNFGDRIEIHDVFYRPTYLTGIRNLYDHRTVGSDAVPYTGQNIPARQYHKASDVNVWEFDLLSIDNFHQAKQEFSVNGSQEVVTCWHCHGNGSITCPSCKGAGIKTCPSCHGNGSQTCHNCFGRGSNSCSSCGGSGSYTRYITETKYTDDGSYQVQRQVIQNCSSCGGSGRKRCYTCGGTGRLQCRRCGGSGKITCSRCSGRGRITCPTCRGNKKMMKYFFITQTLYDHWKTCCVHNADVYERYPKFYIEPIGASGLEKLNITEKNAPLDILDNTHISKAYRNLHQIAMKEPPAGRVGSNTKIQLQNAIVLQEDVFDIDYSYKGKKYRLVVWGHKDDLTVYASESPFSELRDKYIDKAKKKYKWKRLGPAMNALDKANDLDVHNEGDAIPGLRDKITRGMNNQYKISTLIGGILSGGLFGWLSYKFLFNPALHEPIAAAQIIDKTVPIDPAIKTGIAKNLRFILPQINDFYMQNPEIHKIHPFVVSGLFLLYLLLFHKRVYRWMTKYYSTHIRIDILRFIIPTATSIFFAGINWIFLMIANATGLTLIPSWIISLIIKAVDFVRTIIGA